MERPTFKPVGTPVEELDTPALVVDLDALEDNLQTARSFFSEAKIGLRPRLDAHLCREIAHVQMGDWERGFAVSTIAQAEAFAAFTEIEDILILNVAVTRAAIARVAALNQRVPAIIGVNSPKGVARLAEAAEAHRVAIPAAIPISARVNSIGAPPAAAADLAKLIERSRHLHFSGLFAAPTLNLGEDDDVSARLAALLEAQDIFSSRADLPESSIIAAGGSAHYRELARTPWLTEAIIGSYALGDRRLIERWPQIRPAARILATVMSEQEPGLVWLDAGQKATSIDTGLPMVDSVPGASISRMSAEHGGMVLEDGASWDVRLGSKVWLVPHDIANTVNVYDYIHAARNGKLEAVWEVAARGRYD